MATTEKAASHTPGPWHVGTNGDACAVNHAVCSGPIVIAKVYGKGYPTGKGWHPESEADAMLMAAAPELLEALEFAYLNLSDLKSTKDDDSVDKKIRAALAKAKGEHA